MSESDKDKNKGCGRGGRGAFLYSQYQMARRPGAEESTSEDDRSSQASQPSQASSQPSQASLQPSQASSQLSQTSRRLTALLNVAGSASATSSIPSSAAPSPTPSPMPSVGRAAILAALPGGMGIGRSFGRASVIPGGMQVAQSQMKIAPSRSPPAPQPPSSPDITPPIRKMEELQINTLRGEDGRPINLCVNYIRLQVEEGKGIFEYHVNFNPQIDSKNMRFHLMNQASVKEIIGDTKTFDGAKLYLPIYLRDHVTTTLATLPTDSSSVTIHIKFICKCLPGSRDSIQMYNLLLRRIMHKLNMTLVGRNYFDHRAGIPVPHHKLQVWPGYVTAVDEFQDGLMLNCDASFKVLRDVTARDVLVDLYKARRENFQELFIKHVVGAIVITRYNNKTYKIDDVAWTMNPLSTFTNHKGEEIQYKEYYKNAYDITIEDEGQPLLLHRPKVKAKTLSQGDAAAAAAEQKLICLVPELCNLTGLSDDMRSDFKVMKDIATHTRVTPEQRQLTLCKFIQNVNSTPEARKVFADWGLQLQDSPLFVQGRQLDIEKMMVGRGVTFGANAEADWGREMGREHVLVPVHLRNWVVIFAKRDSGKAQEFINMMSRTCPQMGMNIESPNAVVIQNDRTDSYTKAAKDNVNPSVQLVVFIFPTPRDDRYSAVKKLCCVEMPVASQVINVRTISQPQKLRSVVQKIGLQINCKLGGELWAVQIPLKKTLVCGVDVYHDPTRGGRSVVGFIASLNNTFTRWFSIVVFQKAGQELADCLKAALISAIRKFDEVNHFLPEKIIFYRDGVSDGQLSHVQDYEVTQLESCFQNFDNNYQPSLIVIVVQKRINTRLFLRKSSQLDNPLPGSVLDHTITRRQWFDFYLVSQHVRQGTVTPTHYIVLHNRSNLKPDHLQKLSYKLTHLYYNWPGTVRVPAPCQYAHKLAYLCGQNIHREPHLALSDKLFFL